MKNITLIIITLIITNLVSIDAQDILWKKNFGLNTADDFGRTVIELSDGSIIIAGYTGSYGAGGFDVWLIKTDADGDILWNKTYGGSEDDYAYSIKQTDDGGFIIGGATNSSGVGGLDYYLIKTDSDGDTLWTRTFGEGNDDICWSLALADDGYVLAGGKNMQPDHPDIWIIKLDTIGNFIWEKTYGTSADEIAWSIEVTSDNGYIIASHNPINSYDGWLIKLDSNGDSLWTKFYGEDLGDILLYATQTQDGGYILTGRFSEHTGGYTGNVWLIKTDSLGNVEWEKTYDYANDYDIGYSVQQTSDGGFIICGSAIVDEGAAFGWIIRTNEFGDILWTQEVHSYVKSNILSSINTTLFSVIQASNGDYVVTGMQPILPVSDHAQQVVLLRIASDIVPVELTTFTATVEQNSVSLNWQTATETKQRV
ncbi:MAG: PQQ-like beta-propeller repeat protein [Ignavibacteriales bacterium]|nr:PQQ-like beta-propeller repeat protein [Ignavibacteriales bacterium]